MAYTKSIVLFRRDLRLHDNTAFIHAVRESDEVIPLFIFDPRQYSDDNEYKSTRALQFLIQSLDDLSTQISQRDGKLFVLEGNPLEVLKKVINHTKADALFVNEDVTPFSRERDKQIKELSETHDVVFESYHDLFLAKPGSVRTQQGTPYQVFTPFMRQARTQSVPKPQSVPKNVSFASYSFDSVCSTYHELVDEWQSMAVEGGREHALELLDELSELANYVDTRNTPSMKGTSRLSAHHKFGTISVRETFYRVKELFSVNHKLIDELYWRDFYSHLVYDYPELLIDKVAFKQKYRPRLDWEEDDELFRKWANGQTGYPIVDAGMRELNTTGYMHNRVRMIVASFLCKDLRLDWRLGEQYFATQLIDYDPSVNNGSWQWAASTGCDAQPYFRIFNPISQQKKYDPDCEYIKKYVPELRDLSAKQIHKLVETPSSLVEYPRPIVDHSKARKETLEWFKSL